MVFVFVSCARLTMHVPVCSAMTRAPRTILYNSQTAVNARLSPIWLRALWLAGPLLHNHVCAALTCDYNGVLRVCCGDAKHGKRLIYGSLNGGGWKTPAHKNADALCLQFTPHFTERGRTYLHRPPLSVRDVICKACSVDRYYSAHTTVHII